MQINPPLIYICYTRHFKLLFIFCWTKMKFHHTVYQYIHGVDFHSVCSQIFYVVVGNNL